MAHHALRLAAARHVLGLAGPEELVDAADQTMNDGIYSASLCHLGTCREPTLGECVPLFVAALEDVGVPLPDAAGAILTLLTHHAVRLVEGSDTPEQALTAIHSIGMIRYSPYRTVGIPGEAFTPLQPFVSQHYVIEQLHHLQEYGGGGLPNQPEYELGRLHSQAHALALDWCRSRWGPVIEPDWLTPDVLGLAKGIHADGAFDRLPILADALQDAGCESAELLDHLRSGRPHARCCVVVDLVLDRG